MVEDILQSAKQTLIERFASPLLGSFLLSWLGWNWKFMVILFSSASVTKTFDLVHTFAFPDESTIWLKGIIFPLATSLAYVFLYPYPASFVYAFTLKRQREINEIKQRSAEETFLTLEDSRKLRAEFNAHDRHNTEIIQRLNEEVTNLKAVLDNNSKSNDSDTLPSSNPLHGRLESSQLGLLRLLAETRGTAEQSALITRDGNDKLKTEFDLGELERRKLITRIYSNAGKGFKVDFTHEGRKALLESRESSSET